MTNRFVHLLKLIKENSLSAVLQIIYIWLYDRLFDFGEKYQVDVRPSQNKTYSTSNETAIKYGPTKHPTFIKFVLSQLNITREDIIIDIGAGKGLALMVCSLFPFKKIYALELHQELANICDNNMKIFIHNNPKVQCTNYEIINKNALEWIQLSKAGKIKYFYIYLPFPPLIFEQFIQNLVSNQTISKCTFIIYLCNNEVWKYPDILEKNGCIKIKEYDYFRNSPTYIYEYHKEK